MERSLDRRKGGNRRFLFSRATRCASVGVVLLENYYRVVFVGGRKRRKKDISLQRPTPP